MQDHFQDIYTNQAAQYDRLIAREDHEGNILPALETIRPLAGLDVIEFGAGTGRLPRLLAPVVGCITACDIAPAMLNVARETLPPDHQWSLAACDNRRMPFKAGSADLVIAGWSFGHATGWYPVSWQMQISAALSEMQRLLRPGGTAIILETLGTGSETPTPPNARLAAYYAWLKDAQGFTETWIRTDFRFESVAEAEELTRFFFGDALADSIQREQRRIVPECTGIWSRSY